MLVGCAFLLIASGFVSEVPESVRTRLASTNEVCGVFEQIKTDASGREYASKGEYRIRPGMDFTWRVTDPYDAVFFATPTNYVYSNEDVRVSRPLSELPHFGRMAAVSSGDYSVFFKVFDALYREENGRFCLKAKPKDSGLSSMLERVDAEGDVGGDWALTATFPVRGRITVRFRDSKAETR